MFSQVLVLLFYFTAPVLADDERSIRGPDGHPDGNDCPTSMAMALRHEVFGRLDNALKQQEADGGSVTAAPVGVGPYLRTTVHPESLLGGEPSTYSDSASIEDPTGERPPRFYPGLTPRLQ